MNHSLLSLIVGKQTDHQVDIDDAHISVVLCHATGDNAVIHVSDAFEAQTGYSREEALGKNLSFLQGPETEPDAIARFRFLIGTAQKGAVTITNYRKDGKPFRHSVEMRPIFSDDGAPLYIVAAQKAV